MAIFKVIVYILWFCVSVFLVVYAQQTIGIQWLAVMLVGLLGLLLLLYVYNRRYREK